MTDILLPVLLLLGLSMLLMSVRVILVKGGRFRRGHACRSNPAGRRRLLKGYRDDDE